MVEGWWSFGLFALACCLFPSFPLRPSLFRTTATYLFYILAPLLSESGPVSAQVYLTRDAVVVASPSDGARRSFLHTAPVFWLNYRVK